MTRRARGSRGQTDRDRATGLAAAAVAIFLAGRFSRSARPTATGKAGGPTTPPPSPPQRTGLDTALQWLTEPVRKKDQAKRKQEATPKPPEPPKDAGKKLSLCGIALTCGKAPEDEKKPEKKDEDASDMADIVLKVLGAVAAGIGVVGAVTVVGAAIFWVRFDAIGLPATQAVSVIPKAELLVQGAQELSIFVGIGLAAALIVSLADPKGIVTHGTVVVLCGFVAIATGYVVCKDLSFPLTLTLVGLAVVLALLCVAIAFNTGQRLLPLLVSIFLASLIFSSSCALTIVNDQKYAQAIAIRFGVDEEGVGKGLTGIYVTATADTIYFAQTGVDPDLGGSVDTTGLYEVHRADTTTYAVGPLEPVNRKGKADPVEERAETLLQRLNKDGENFIVPKDEEEEEEEEEETKDGASTDGS